MTNLTEDGEYLLAKNQSEHPKPSELKPYKKQYLADREKKYFEKNEIGKFDFRSKWPLPVKTSGSTTMFKIICRGFCQTKVHCIKTARYIFYRIRNMIFGQTWLIKMMAISVSKLKVNNFWQFSRIFANFDISIPGKNSTEIAATEARVVEELEAFRTEKFMYFLFINALWMIVTSIILLYTDSLISIDIEIPRGETTAQFTSPATAFF